MALDFEFPTPLVSVEWLAAHLTHASLRLCDFSYYLASAGRQARAEYEAGHIPGALFVDIERFSDEAAPYPHTLPAPEVLAARFGGLGIGDEHAVVVYDGSGQHFSAPRLWYMLRALGHQRVAVLDGGLPAWRNAGHALTRDVPVYVPATLSAHFDAKQWRELSDMTGNVLSRREQVVDARSASRFSADEPEPRAGVRGGHIPGARHVHYASLVTSDGLLKDADTLRSQFQNAGVRIDAPIVATCGSGVTAAAVLLALDVAGAKQTALYDGSWTEWGSQSDTPIEVGAAHSLPRTT